MQCQEQVDLRRGGDYPIGDIRSRGDTRTAVVMLCVRRGCRASLVWYLWGLVSEGGFSEVIEGG